MEIVNNINTIISSPLMTIFLSIVCSVIAANVFWRFSFKAATTKIVFSPNIERRFRDNRYRLRVRFINTGPADLYDIRFIARLAYKPMLKNGTVQGRATVAYINIGQRSFSPILYGKRIQKQKRNTVFSWTATLNESEDFYSTFSRSHNPDYIVEKAKNKTLTFDDVFEAYKQSAKIKIFAFGIDSMTGIEKMFISSEYAVNDIITGNYNHANVNIKNYKKYVEHILSVKPQEY